MENKITVEEGKQGYGGQTIMSENKHPLTGIFLDKVVRVLWDLKEKGYVTKEINKELLRYIESEEYLQGIDGTKSVIENIVNKIISLEGKIGVRLQERDRDYYKKVAEESFKKVYEESVYENRDVLLLQERDTLKEIKEYYYGYIKVNKMQLYREKEIYIEMNKQALLKVTVKINSKVSNFLEKGIQEVIGHYLNAKIKGDIGSQEYLDNLPKVNYFDFCIGSLMQVAMGESKIHKVDKFLDEKRTVSDTSKIAVKNREDANKDKKRFDRFLKLYELDLQSGYIEVDDNLKIGNGVIKYVKKDIYIEIIGYSLVRCQIGRLSSLDTFTCKVNEPVKEFEEKIRGLFIQAQQIDESVDVDNIRKILMLYVKASDLRKNRYLKD